VMPLVKTHRISGTDLYVAVTGVRGVHIKNIDETLKKIQSEHPGTIFQLFDADKVAGERHIYFAAVNAVDAQSKGSAISRRLDVETLLYASCQDQISKALKLMGVTNKTRRVAVLVFGESESEAVRVAEGITDVLGELDDDVLKVTPEKYELLKKAYGVSEESIKTVGLEPNDALTSLIIEKGALMPILR
jgi:tRNA threonylcarbamoyladenosine modification (KEOPS) complex Cgi121 subunit